MKYFSILIILFLVSSCSTTKSTIKSTAQSNKDVIIVTEVPDAVDNEPASDDTEIHQMVEVVDSNGNTTAEVESEEEAAEILKNLEQNSIKHDSVVYVSQGYFTLNHSEWNDLLKKYVSKNGTVDYLGLKKNKQDLNNYINSLTETIPNEKWSRNEKLAYWINTYNALTIDLIIRNYPLESIKDIKDPWDQRLWKFGDKWQNLNDIEHKILRKMNEPRIHFAIVCASESCPKLINKAFTGDDLEAQLTNVTKGFLSDASKNEISKNKIKLSKIFKWFKKDFESDGNLIDFLNQYADITISSSAKRSYKDYNWDLNN